MGPKIIPSTNNRLINHELFLQKIAPFINCYIIVSLILSLPLLIYRLSCSVVMVFLFLILVIEYPHLNFIVFCCLIHPTAHAHSRRQSPIHQQARMQKNEYSHSHASHTHVTHIPAPHTPASLTAANFWSNLTTSKKEMLKNVYLEIVHWKPVFFISSKNKVSFCFVESLSIALSQCETINHNSETELLVAMVMP